MTVSELRKSYQAELRDSQKLYCSADTVVRSAYYAGRINVLRMVIRDLKRLKKQVVER